MRFELDGRVHAGRAVDLRGTDATTESVLEALELDADDPLGAVTADPPSLVRTLARAARSRGHGAPQDDRIAELRDRLADRDAVAGVDGPDPAGSAAATDLATARERAAEAAADVDMLRERVAAARGRLQAAREAGTDVDERAEEHAAAAQDLTDAETDRVAAEQALEAATERARERRVERRRTLRLRDELGNREREARRALARGAYREFSATLERVPGKARPGDGPTEFEGDRVTAHLAAVALADRGAPVVLAVDRFEGPAAAATRLGVPVVQL
ncbi:DUF7856 family protein [Halorarum salinum]|uniref:Uncharacterized protein n=1 Tax=Halorarum salinum TaxID=2743089 RepID=A0A7D5QA63_9EURY|nr:hypothetical protein [Halobaculum salinum]QLG60680.1 hypothetical protein HUG12_02545 [Halobaculum salinum]